MIHSDFEFLKCWLTEHGGHIHPAVKRRFANGMYGLFTDEPLKKSEVVVDVPRSLMLGPDRDTAVLRLLTAAEEGERSKFYPWICQLPTLNDFRSYHPLFATEEELKQLDQLNPRITRTLNNYQNRIEEFHQSTAERFEFSQVAWASLIYLTRAFEGNGLVPVCDMFNHDALRGRGLIGNRYIQAACDLRVGEEVFISYGRQFDSLELWLHFGFIDATRGPVIGCAGVKSGAAGLVFDQDCYIDGSGPSARLIEVCGNQRIMNGLRRALLQELGDCGEPVSPLVRQAQQLIQERRRLASVAFTSGM